MLLKVAPSEVAVGWTHRHRHVEIARRHLVSRADQLADRPHKTVGNGDAGPDGGENDDQRHRQIGKRESDLRRAPVRFQPAIFIDIGAHDLPGLDHFRVDHPDRVEKQPLKLAQLDDRAHDVARARLNQQRRAAFGLLDGAFRWLRHGEISRGLRAHHE
jgi:hypothetical protein